MKVEAGEALAAGRSHIIKRPRLTRLLDEATARIILLVAPAGYGKTTLAREWLTNRTHAWYRATSASADVAALALGIGRAASSVLPGADERLATRLRISSAPAEDVEVLAQLLADDLAHWPSETWLAVDDYHFACDSEASERFVDLLISTSPLRVLIASRSRPNWASARRLLYGEIYEIGRGQLAMSAIEAQSVVQKPIDSEAEGLIALTDGWPALVGVAALVTQFESPAGRLPEELYTYFAEEMYRALPLETQGGLRRLALAATVTPQVATDLAGRDAGTIIREAERLGFFLSSESTKREFHPLLRTFLASKFLENRDDPEGVLVSRLGRTLIEREEWDEAFDLIEKFFDESLFAELLEAALIRMVHESRLPTLERWIEVARSHKSDSALIGVAESEVAFKRGDLHRAEAVAMQTALRFAPVHPFKSRVLWLAGTSAHLTWRDREALDYFRQAQTAAHSEFDSRQSLWGSFLVMDTLELEADAQALFEEIRSKSDSSVDDLLRIATGSIRLALLSGRLSEALDACVSLPSLEEKSHDPLVCTSFLNAYAGALALAGRYEEAATYARSELALASRYSLDFVIPLAHMHLAEGHWGLCNVRACKTSIGNAERTNAGPDGGFLMSVLTTLRARLCLARKAPEEAIATLDEGYRNAIGSSMHAEYLAWWSLAHALADDDKRAISLADRAFGMSRRVEVAGLVPWTKSIVAIRSGRDPRDAIERAFRTTLTTGNVDAFVAAYRSDDGLLDVVAQDCQTHDELKVILERAHDADLATRVGLRTLPAASRGKSTLTRREAEVIGLVSQGFTNKDIGRALFITEATVKAHVRKICQKLGARSRTEAAMRASELCE